MENIKTCPIHVGRELKEFTAGPKAKNPGMKYHKCTYKTDINSFCDYVLWPEQDFSYTKKFTQTPTGVVETEEVWPTESSQSVKTAPETHEPSLADVMDSLSRLHVKVNKLLGNAEEN